MKNKLFNLVACFLLVILASSCKLMPDWLGVDDEEKLPGERIPVIIKSNSLQIDEYASRLNVTIPEAAPNSSFSDGTEQFQNLALGHPLKKKERVSYASSPGSDYRMAVNPIAANGVIYVVDFSGEVFAHNADDINKILWQAKLFEVSGEAMLSGGITYSDKKLFITSSNGTVYCISSEDGKKLWQRNINIPIRSAPVVKNNNVIFITSTNEVYAISAEDGKTAWNFSGIFQDTGILGSITPSANERIVVAPFSSGEVTAIDIETGQPIWADSLTSRIKSTSGFLISDIIASPVIMDNLVFIGSSQNLFTAKEVNSGQSLWEKKISILRTPWATRDFIFLLSASDELICVHNSDGIVKWITQLPSYVNQEKKQDKISYNGPILAGDRLLVVASNGELLSISPLTGEILNKTEIPDEIFLRPVVANNTLFLLDNSGNLTSYY